MNESPAELRPETLSAVGAGMTRLRVKGGASKESLYELNNGYVAASKAPTQRPGTRWKFNFADPALSKAANAGKTKGLVAFKGIVYTFAANTSPIITSGSGTYVIVPLHHPNGTSSQLKAIHFAKPFMGLLYVVAEFLDGAIAHFWLQNPTAWKAGTIYQANQLVQPTTPNGLYYKAVQLANPQSWTALLQHYQYDYVQPSTYNGFQYQALYLQGAVNPPTTTTASFTIPAVGSSTSVAVASVTNISIGATPTIADASSNIISVKVTNVVGLTITFTTLSILNGSGPTMSSGATVSVALARSGSTEPSWSTMSGAITMDVSSASPPATPQPPPAQPNTTPAGLQSGGRYTNRGGSGAAVN